MGLEEALFLRHPTGWQGQESGRWRASEKGPSLCSLDLDPPFKCFGWTNPRCVHGQVIGVLQEHGAQKFYTVLFKYWGVRLQKPRAVKLENDEHALWDVKQEQADFERAQRGDECQDADSTVVVVIDDPYLDAIFQSSNAEIEVSDGKEDGGEGNGEGSPGAAELRVEVIQASEVADAPGPSAAAPPSAWTLASLDLQIASVKRLAFEAFFVVNMHAGLKFLANRMPPREGQDREEEGVRGGTVRVGWVFGWNEYGCPADCALRHS